MGGWREHVVLATRSAGGNWEWLRGCHTPIPCCPVRHCLHCGRDGRTCVM